LLPAAAAKDSQAFTAELIGEKKRVADVGWSCGGRQVDGFGHSAVAKTLERGLHAHMMFRRDVVCRYEQPANTDWNAGDVLDRRACPEFCPEAVDGQAFRTNHAQKGGVRHGQLQAVQSSAKNVYAVEGLDAG